MRKKHGLDVKKRRMIAYVLLIAIAVICLFWLYILVVNATRTDAEMKRGFTMIPAGNLWVNWKNLLESPLPVIRSMCNSLIVSTFASVFSIYFAALAAYGFHMYEFRGKHVLMTFVLMIMMVPTQVNTLGYLQLVNHMNLADTFLSLILPRLAVPVTFYYVKQYLESMSLQSLVEAARIDGAGEMHIFHRMVVPLIRPALAVQIIFEFVASWNNYFLPALLLHSDDKKTLPIIIGLLRSANFVDQDEGQIYVCIAFAILPVVVIYLLLSKMIIQGLTAGGDKG